MSTNVEDTQQKVKKNVKSILKKLLVPVIIIIMIIVILISAIYSILGDDCKEMSKGSVEYENNAKITAGGIVTYKSDEEGNLTDTEITGEDVANNISCLSNYIQDDKTEGGKTKEEKLEYLLNAELVTKFPYIEGVPEDKLNGNIKFKRVEETGETSNEYLMTFADEERFEELLENYKATGNKEIYKYFTIDEEQNVIIAYGSQTTKTVTTNDADVTLDVVKEKSGDQKYVSQGDCYTTTTYSISKQQIDYLSLVEPYIMPFNLLASLLVQTRDYRIVEDMAKLAYDSQIVIGIYDNTSQSTTKDEYTYNKKIEYSANTKLNFSGLSNITTATINIEDEEYANVVESCVQNIAEPLYFGEHRISKIGGAQTISGAVGIHATEYAKERYIKSISSKIQELTSEDDAYEFNTTFSIYTLTHSSPTKGIVLADTWIAKWTVQYKQDIKESGSSSSGEQEDAERVMVANGPATEEIFEGSAANEVNGVLTTHSKSRKGSAVTADNSEYSNTAIYQIYQIAKDRVQSSPRTITANDITKDAVTRCAEGCGLCQSKLNSCFRIGTNYNRLTDAHIQNIRRATAPTDPNDQYSLWHVKTHVMQMLQNEANNNAANDLAEKKEQLKKDLEREITYNQWPTVYKTDVNIKFTTTMARTSTTYSRDTTEMENEGQKFKEVFRKENYNESRKAIIGRIEWFWEYIRENENTAKLENVLRYLLNIATDSQDFGTFTEEDIKNIFKAFEPRELNSTKTSGHLQAFLEWLKSYENDALRGYMNDEGGVYTYEAAKKYVTEDKELGLMMAAHNQWEDTLNFTYGIMVYDYSKEERGEDGEIDIKKALNNEKYFVNYGYDLENMVRNYYSLLKRYGTDSAIPLSEIAAKASVPMEDLEKIKEDIVRDKVKSIKDVFEEHGVTAEPYQYYALTSVAYQWGNCGQHLDGSNNIAEMYKKYYLEEESPEDFRKNALLEAADGSLVHFFTNRTYANRIDSAWLMFSEGRYILNNGVEIFASAAGTVVEFALQFEGCTAAQVRTDDDPPGGLFEYKTSDGVQFADQEWCADFVSYCFDKCGMIEAIGGTYQACSRIRILRDTNSDLYRDNMYLPQAGDVIFYTKNGGLTSYHTGIVVSCDGTKIITIEGNMGNSVNSASTVQKTQYHTVGEAGIFGYIVPSE